MTLVETVGLLSTHLLDAPARCGASRLLCVDGPAGSGKSTLADRLASALGGAPVVHMDDLYEGWDQDLGSPLAARVEAWLLLPWCSGLAGKHLRFDWAQGRFTEWVEVPAAPVLVLEGCGAGSATLRGHSSALIWVEAPADVRLRRGLARDGEAMAPQWRAWQEREAAHFARDGTRDAATAVLDGVTGRLRPT